MNLVNVQEYNGQHAVTFTKDSTVKNTWIDWGLVPSSRHSEPVNGIWSHQITISGVNGQEDLVRMYPYNAVNNSSKLESAVKKDNRDGILSDSGYKYDIFTPSSGSMSFLIADQTKSFFSIEQEIVNFLHNEAVTMKMVDSSKTYTVRTTVESFSNSPKYSGVTINYAVISEE